MGPPVYSLKVKYILNIHEIFKRQLEFIRQINLQVSIYRFVYISVLLYGTKFVPENDIMGESYPTVQKFTPLP